MHLIRALIIAFSSYSRIPMPQVDWSDESRRYSMCFFPLVGVVTALLLSLWLSLCDACGVGVFLRGAAGAVIPLLVTGGIHMDGFMDVSDAMASWQPTEKRLEILKDSHVGAFAVMKCACYLLLFAGCVSELHGQDAPLLVAAMVISRGLSAWAMCRFPQARREGMLADNARHTEKQAVETVSICWCIAGLAGGALLCGWPALFLGVPCLVCLGWYRHRAMKYFGGVTGDQAGWFVQTTELACVALIALWRVVQ